MCVCMLGEKQVAAFACVLSGELALGQVDGALDTDGAEVVK